MEPNGYQFPQIVISSGEKGGRTGRSQEVRKMLWGLPPIHFGKEDDVERTLLRVACQSETFLASPWQGGAILHASVAHWLPK